MTQRCALLAFVTDGKRLYQVTDDQRGCLVLENCQTEVRLTISRSNIASYKLVLAAPGLPDAPLEEPEPVHSE